MENKEIREFMTKTRLERASIISALIIMSVLVFLNLGNRFFWLDEADTAVLGKRVYQFGYPRAWDGNNIITAANGNDFNEHFIHLRYPWLQFYIAALGQNFGGSSFSVRFIFALIGVMSCLPLYLLANILIGNRKVAHLAMWLYVLSVPVILYIRQVRYYSPSLLLIILIYLFYLKFIDKPKLIYLIAYTISAVLLFNTFLVFFFVTMFVIYSCYLLFDRSINNIKRFAISTCIIIALTLPVFGYYENFLHEINSLREGFVGWYYFVIQILGYIWQLHAYFFPFLILELILLILCFQDKKRKKTPQTEKIKNMRQVWLLLAPVIFTLLSISSLTAIYGTRFLISSLPLVYIICALLIYNIFVRDYVIGVTLTILIVFTNVLNISPYLAIKYTKLDTKYFESFIKPPVPFFSYQFNHIRFIH